MGDENSLCICIVNGEDLLIVRIMKREGDSEELQFLVDIVC